MEESLREVVDEIEAEKSLGKVAGYEVFRSRINQPNLLAVRSTDAIQGGSGTGFSEMLFNIPRSILEVETIQLLTANIPQCVPSIPDTACGFWYYRLSEYSGKVPNPENLFCVRLLPSYYKQEWIDNPQLYGFNKTLNSYPQLATALALSCSTDLAYYNQLTFPELQNRFRTFFLPNEISLPYSADINKFKMIGTNARTQLAYKAFSIIETYGLGDVVTFANNTYKSLVAGNVGNYPDTEPTFWVQVYVDIVAPYSGTTPYPAGRYVSYNNLLYRSLVPTTGNLPTNTSFWSRQIERGLTNYRYLIAGFDDPNVALLQGTARRTWNEFALYEAGTIVAYNGSYWSALFQNQGQEPFVFSVSLVWNNTTKFRAGDVVAFGAGPRFYKARVDNVNQTPSISSTIWTLQSWTITGTASRIVGLNTISAECDLVNDAGDFGFFAPFPEGIPAQPFNPVPKRLLNSILGFSWNGIMTPSQLSTIQQSSQTNFIPTTLTDLYNRLRPIPIYLTTDAVSLGETETSSITQTYTADGYCNLVYSSIVSIYASVVYGSTTDSKRNTSLLACGSMNCGNLGVSFFAGFVDNPLLIEGNDIYDLSISLQDEYGEPYVLTNNAVASFTFKLTYKTKG
jgi:hypothetical protein